MTAPDPRVGEIQARLDAATPGPWEWEGESRESWPQSDNSLVTAYTPEGEQWPEAILYGWGYDASGITVQKDADGELIAHAPADVAYLLAKLADRDEKLARVKAHMEDPEHYDTQGPSNGYVSVDNLRAAVDAADGGESNVS